MALPTRSHAHAHPHPHPHAHPNSHPIDPARRKKRHHPHHTHPHGTASASHDADDEEDDPAAFVSSSRDASEEDNDQETFDDSASTLSVASARGVRSSSSTQLPTSARDRALASSNPAYQNAPTSPSPLASRATPPLASGDATPGAHALSPAPLAQPTSSSAAQTSASAPANARPIARRTGSASSAGSSNLGAGVGGALTAAPSLAERRTAAPALVTTLPDEPVGMNASQQADGGAETEAGLAARTPMADAGRAGALPMLSALTPESAHARRSQAPTGGGGGGDTRERDQEPDAGTESATPYDGDVEYAARAPTSAQVAAQSGAAVAGSGAFASASVTSPEASARMAVSPRDVPSRPFVSSDSSSSSAPAPRAAAEVLEQPIPIRTPEEIRAYINAAIYSPDPKRDYKINQPPEGGRGRPIRIYADGVYDLFHYAHALQLRQAKLFFPSVHLIVGVVSSTNCAKHKNLPVLSSSERYASVRNCRWVDEVVEDAPWVIDQELMDKLNVDYVAHDEAPYGGQGSEDIYRFAKDQGKFLPTLRTPGVSTSELLARIVGQYRAHSFDKKLEKIGCSDLAFFDN